MKKWIWGILFIGLVGYFFIGPSACDCLEMINDYEARFEKGGIDHSKKVASCYEKFSPEKYQKYTGVDEWEKQLRHGERMQPLAEQAMMEKCN